MNLQEELHIDAKPHAIYDVYKKVNRWDGWDPGVESASLDNGLAIGITGTLIPSKEPKTKIEITEATSHSPPPHDFPYVH